MAVTLYQSGESGAPTLTGENGSLVALLLACLVNGYGGKAGAGWTRPYTGTGKAVFKAGAGTQACLWIDDNAPGGGAAREARARGYEAMTGLDAGSGPFPTTSQMAVPVILRKSASTDATIRPWIVLADDKRFYLFLDNGDSAGNLSGFFFGDLNSVKTGGDAYSGAIIGRTTENSATASHDVLPSLGTTGPNSSALGAHYVARSHDPTNPVAVNFGKFAELAYHSGSTMGAASNFTTTPNPPDGGIYFTPIMTCHGGAARGRMPGLWAPCHNRYFSHGVTITGSGETAGRSLLLINTLNSGQLALDLTGPW
ncbi:MAG: hypothetical protein HQL51_01665 [Magnetococcales bacterium]|nr:hypothetical protein [Magnetococcales bacterium]